MADKKWVSAEILLATCGILADYKANGLKGDPALKGLDLIIEMWEPVAENYAPIFGEEVYRAIEITRDIPEDIREIVENNITELIKAWSRVGEALATSNNDQYHDGWYMCRILQ